MESEKLVSDASHLRNQCMGNESMTMIMAGLIIHNGIAELSGSVDRFTHQLERAVDCLEEDIKREAADRRL